MKTPELIKSMRIIVQGFIAEHEDASPLVLSDLKRDEAFVLANPRVPFAWAVHKQGTHIVLCTARCSSYPGDDVDVLIADDRSCNEPAPFTCEFADGVHRGVCAKHADRSRRRNDLARTRSFVRAVEDTFGDVIPRDLEWRFWDGRAMWACEFVSILARFEDAS